MSGPDCDKCGEHCTDCRCYNLSLPPGKNPRLYVLKPDTKWTKFKDGAPHKNYNVHVTDWVSVWTCLDVIQYANYSEGAPNNAWAEISLPEVPKEPKEAHHCAKGQFSTHESPKDNTLALKFQNDSFTYYCFIDHCPFCGYKAKE